MIATVIRTGAACIALLLAPSAAGVDHADVGRIFAARCLRCHGPEKQKADLRVDVRASLLRGGSSGQPAVVPGDPGRSRLLAVVRGDDPESVMPPATSGQRLDQEEIARLEAWIRAGAPMPETAVAPAAGRETWWSLRPIARPAPPPAPAGTDPVDAFLLAALAARGLDMGPPERPEILLRRAALVATGLPMEPAQLAEAVAAWPGDPEGTYRRCVDALLASPRFGERWAQHWLDAVRWAESGGSESNYFRKNAWPYRDYVIAAFNADTPYDRFLREQIAGDALGQDIAMGFLVAGPCVPPETVGRERLAQLEARCDRLDEIVQGVANATMAMTMGCARCHDHKYDPIPIDDYYAMVAVFQDIEYEHHLPRLAAGHPRNVAGRAIAAEMEPHRALLAAHGAWEEIHADRLVVQVPPTPASQVRIVFPDGKAVLDEIEIYGVRDGGDNLALAIRGAGIASARDDDPTRPVGSLIDGLHGGFWAWKAGRAGADGAWVRVDLPARATIARVELSADRFPHEGTERLSDHGTKAPRPSYRIEVRADAGAAWTAIAASTAVAALRRRERPAAAMAALDALARRYDQEGPQPVFAGRPVPPAPTRVLGRGSPARPGREVTANGLSALGADLGLRPDSPGPARRLAFADWLARRDHPLTARVHANRIWHHVFGTGIVDTPGDFGAAGARPAHPELLDWLASALISEGWSTKRLVRRLLLTRAFRQSSVPRPEALAIDAGRRLLWRFPPRRADAEILRDGILAAAGTLDERMGGPGYRIHPAKKRFQQWVVDDNAGPATWRRLIYQERMRGVDDRMFSAFDLPDCTRVAGQRPVSTTPLQALNLLNGDLVLRQSERAAERIRREAGVDPAAQVERAFVLVLGRRVDDDLRAAARELVAADGLPALLRALFNSNAFAFID